VGLRPSTRPFPVRFPLTTWRQGNSGCKRVHTPFPQPAVPFHAMGLASSYTTSAAPAGMSLVPAASRGSRSPSTPHCRSGGVRAAGSPPAWGPRCVQRVSPPAPLPAGRPVPAVSPVTDKARPLSAGNILAGQEATPWAATPPLGHPSPILGAAI
jgi:hypothetical protein